MWKHWNKKNETRANFTKSGWGMRRKCSLRFLVKDSEKVIWASLCFSRFLVNFFLHEKIGAAMIKKDLVAMRNVKLNDKPKEMREKEKNLKNRIGRAKFQRGKGKEAKIWWTWSRTMLSSSPRVSSFFHSLCDTSWRVERCSSFLSSRFFFLLFLLFSPPQRIHCHRFRSSLSSSSSSFPSFSFSLYPLLFLLDVDGHVLPSPHHSNIQCLYNDVQHRNQRIFLLDEPLTLIRVGDYFKKPQSPRKMFKIFLFSIVQKLEDNKIVRY